MLVRGWPFLLGAKKPKEYSDIAEILCEADALNENERESFRNMIKFRNLLIHVYVGVSPNIVYRIAKERSKGTSGASPVKSLKQPWIGATTPNLSPYYRERRMSGATVKRSFRMSLFFAKAERRLA